MKPILLTIGLALSLAFTNTQADDWKIFHNKKLLLSTSEESETKNVRAIPLSDLDKAGELIVMYEEGNPDKEWKRTIAIVDDNDKSLFEKAEINKIQVSNADLKKLAAGKTKLKIYTWAIPKDPAKAALVRIRKVHLCTITLR